MKSRLNILVFLSGFLLPLTAVAQSPLQLLSNGDFELPNGSPGPVGARYVQIPASEVPGWSTTATDNKIELWGSGFGGGGSPVYTANGLPGPLPGFYDGGKQFAEINATQAGALYQDVTFTQSGGADYFLLHRGRTGVDTMRLTILYLGVNGVFNSTFDAATGSYTPGGDDTIAYTITFSDGNISNAPGTYNGWVPHYGDNVFTTVAGGVYRYAFAAVSTANHNNSTGNFIDNAAFGLDLQDSFAPVPEPSSYGLWTLAAVLALGIIRRLWVEVRLRLISKTF